MRNLAFTRDAIAGGLVQRAFTAGNSHYRAGDRLAAEAILAMPPSNMRALVENRFIELFPKHEVAGERFIVPADKGHFNVIVGHKLNSAPLSRDEAEDLATRP